jgi:FkbM family methyltransferase
MSIAEQNIGLINDLFLKYADEEIDIGHNKLLDQIKLEGIFIFGAHKVGSNLKKICDKKNIRTIGFFDNDDSKINQTLHNLKVLKPDYENTNNKFIVVASGRYSNQIIEQLSQYNCVPINIHKFQYLFDLKHQAEFSFRNFRTSLFLNQHKVLMAFNRLSDDKSKKTFIGLIKLRIELNISHTDQFKCDFTDEYIDSEFITKQDMISFVDVGAYDGDTLDRIERKLSPAKKAYLFEPEIAPYIKGVSKYKDRESIYMFNFGLSDNIYKCKYENEFTFDSPTNNKQTITIPSIQFLKLDNLGIDDPSFIKIDVEGGELNVLRGAQELIKKHKPKLAVCAYHRANDYWELIEYVTNLNPAYKVGMRHYSDILDDTTLYFY